MAKIKNTEVARQLVIKYQTVIDNYYKSPFYHHEPREYLEETTGFSSDTNCSLCNSVHKKLNKETNEKVANCNQCVWKLYTMGGGDKYARNLFNENTKITEYFCVNSNYIDIYDSLNMEVMIEKLQFRIILLNQLIEKSEKLGY